MDKLNEYDGHYEPETLKDRLLGVYTVGDGKGYELTREFPQSVTPISNPLLYITHLANIHLKYSRSTLSPFLSMIIIFTIIPLCYQ